MVPMNRVLAPTDYSEVAAHALRYARELARTYRAELHVLHVVPMPTTSGHAVAVGTPVPSDSLADAVTRESSSLTTFVREQTKDQPVEPKVAVRVGLAWQEIVRYAADEQIDLIVIGTHARGLLKRVLLGSVSRAVLEHVHCPVLMVPIAGTKREPGEDSAQRIDPADGIARV